MRIDTFLDVLCRFTKISISASILAAILFLGPWHQNRRVHQRFSHSRDQNEESKLASQTCKRDVKFEHMLPWLCNKSPFPVIFEHFRPVIISVWIRAPSMHVSKGLLLESIHLKVEIERKLEIAVTIHGMHRLRCEKSSFCVNFEDFRSVSGFHQAVNRSVHVWKALIVWFYTC